MATLQVSPSISSTTSAPIKRWSVPCHPLDLKMGYPNHWLIHHFPIEVAMAIDGTSVDPISRQTLPKSYKSKTSCIICQKSKTWILSSAEFAPFFKPAKNPNRPTKQKRCIPRCWRPTKINIFLLGIAKSVEPPKLLDILCLLGAIRPNLTSQVNLTNLEGHSRWMGYTQLLSV